VRNVALYLRINRLIINIQKSLAMLIATAKRLSMTDVSGFHVEIDGQEIKNVKDSKLLGVILDETLSFEKHIIAMSKKISQKIGLLRRLRTILPRTHLITVYNTLVMPHMDYCDVIWGTCGQTLFQRIFRLQKRAIRTLMNVGYRDHTAPLFHELKWLPLKERQEFHTCILVYKGLHSMLPSTICDMLKYVDHRDSRSVEANELYVPKPRLEHIEGASVIMDCTYGTSSLLTCVKLLH
jgi:hypothetical protein